MKKILSFLLVIIYVHAGAQVTTSVKAGVGLSTLRFKGDDNNQMRVVGYGGLSFQVELPNRLFFQPELLYSMRGYKYPATVVSSKGSLNFGYITAPLLIGYKLSKSFSIVAGPELGYLVRARSKFEDGSADLYDGINRKFNVDVDAGVTWMLGESIALEARANFGVIALYRGVLTDNMGNYVGDFKDGYHRVLQLGISVPF